MATVWRGDMLVLGTSPIAVRASAGLHSDRPLLFSRSESLPRGGCLAAELLGGSGVGSSGTAFHRLRKKSRATQLGSSMASGCRCMGEGAWFEIPPEKSDKNSYGQSPSFGDFKILAHLQHLGCGDFKRPLQEVHFGGCINEAYACHCTGGDYFVKINRRFDMESMFSGELEALARMKQTKTIQVPNPLGCGNLSDGGSYLIMEHLHFRPFGMLKRTSQEALGRSLAQMHLADVGPFFGFSTSTRLGVLPLSNSWSTSWSEFFIEKRLRERLLVYVTDIQGQRAYAAFSGHETDIQRKGDLVLERAAAILEGYHVRPSILHGDLWMGNAGLVATGEVAIFDPACFFGDAEFDLAFQDWSPSQGFPGFSEHFYQSYHALVPRAPGFDKRHKLYQLYHLLNHLLLYQVEYFKHVVDTMDQILKD